MENNLTRSAVDFFIACDLAKSLTGKTPESGTQCWIYNMDEAGRLNRKCEKCPYYSEFQKPETIGLEEKPAYALVKLPQTLTEKGLPDLRKILDGLVLKNARVVMLDCDKLEQVSTPALSVILRAFKLLKEKGGEFFLLNPTESFNTLLRSTMLIKVLPMARSAVEVEAMLARKAEEIKSGEAKRKEEEMLNKKKKAESLRCFEFWKGHHIKNATPCSICHYKVSGSISPCWTVSGEIEGITFEYTNEDCLDCSYYLKLNPDGDVQEII